MADIKFTCPHCQQEIQCDQLWGGHEINCPTCKGTMVVPQSEAPAANTNPLVPKPPSGPSPRLSAGKTQVARSSTATGAPQKQFHHTVEKKQSPLLKYALIVVVVAALAAGGYYGYDLLLKGKDKFNATAEASSKRPVGGEVGQAMDANDALDKTDPNRSESPLKAGIKKRINKRRVAGVQSAADSEAALADDSGSGGRGGAPASEKDLPVVAPVYTLDVSTVKIAASKVNGVISGGNFVADTARIDKGADYYALTLRQGIGPTPDRAVRVFLRLKPTEVPTNQTFTVSSDTKDPAVSRVSKLWKTSAGFAPTEQKYTSNYALKLELGQMENGMIPGKIFLALDDTDKTVVAGQFKAPLIIPSPSAQAAQPAYTPPAGTPGAAAAARQRRYGR
jgi:hypothetical protein